MRDGLWKESLKNVVCFAVIFIIFGSYLVMGHDKFNSYIADFFGAFRPQDKTVGESDLNEEMSYLGNGIQTVEMPEQIQLKLEDIRQLPELPTGCESVALTMQLKYYGFDDLNKTTIVDNYLVYSDDNFVEGFAGDPYQQLGGGCYAPAIEATANKFFQDRGSSLQACDITGASMEELYGYVAKGTPVLVWNTIDMADPVPSGIKCEYNGKEYEWNISEHCVVLSGYNKDTNTVYVNDPLKGFIENDAARFEEIYNSMGKMAVIFEEI